MDEGQLLEPYDGLTTASRAVTEDSAFAERLIGSFLRFGADTARVRWELTDYDADTLYRRLRDTAKKKELRALVEIHKKGDALILVRRKRER